MARVLWRLLINVNRDYIRLFWLLFPIFKICLLICLSIFPIFFFFGWDWGLNSGLCRCSTTWVTPPGCFALIIFGDGGLSVSPSWSQILILPISISQVLRIIGLSHWCPAPNPNSYIFFSVEPMLSQVSSLCICILFSDILNEKLLSSQKTPSKLKD
jgi:hypothetical protein